MRVNILFAILLLPLCSMAQLDTTELKFDMLSAPQSPAANLLGFSDSEIMKPESPTDFMVNVRNATSDFTKIPSSFSMDFRTKGILDREGNNLSTFVKTDDKWNNIKQTFILSVGYKNYDALKDSLKTGQALSAGFKFSILRGSYSQKFSSKYDSLKSHQRKLSQDGLIKFEEFLESDEYDKLSKDRVKYAKLKVTSTKAEDIAEYTKRYNEVDEQIKALTEKHNKLRNEQEDIKEKYEKISGIIGRMEFKTYGWHWDVAGGIVLDYPDNRFDYCLVGKSGLWTTFGYEGEKGLSLLSMARALYTPGMIYENNLNQIDTSDVGNYDFGTRIVYENPGKSFSLSAEWLYRGTFNNEYNPTYRLTFNAGYEVAKNMKLTFVFGRNFDGEVSKSGTLISAVNFVMGLGSKKSIF